VPWELWSAIRATVVRTCERSGWTVRRVLAVLGLSRSTFYAACGRVGRPRRVQREVEVHAALPEEREAVIAYALAHPELRHRELAWRMVDEDVAYLSPSTVYRILLAKDLVHRWEQPKPREKFEREKPSKPDEKWQSDLRYVRVGSLWYFLITFADECSRYIVHHEVLRWMDGHSVSLAAQAALDGLPPGVEPVIQTDRGSGYVSREFKLVLSENGIGHHLIRPHCPEENGLIERIQRTLGEQIDEHELENVTQAERVIGQIIRWYNEERLHSAIGFLRPIDVYRGNPQALLEERRRKIAAARHRRKEENLGRRQRSLVLEPASPLIGSA
jgi:transposase InsO family protein